MERLAGQVSYSTASSSSSAGYSVRPAAIPWIPVARRALKEQGTVSISNYTQRGNRSPVTVVADKQSEKPTATTTTAPADTRSQHVIEAPGDSSSVDLLEKGLVEQGPAEGGSGAVASLTFFAGIGLLALAGYLFKDQVASFVDFFVDAKDSWGVWGYLLYAAVYTGLEVLAVPAIPLTMTAGVIFGTLPGTAIVSLSGTLAAVIAFVVARYGARDKVRKFASRYPNFQKIDKAIAKDGLKFVALLRLSPLLPLAASNYLYGLTSVDLLSYSLGSWIGMLPGTYAYVSAGEMGRAVLMEGEGSVGVETWQVGLALGVTLLVLGYVGNLAKQAIEDEGQ